MTEDSVDSLESNIRPLRLERMSRNRERQDDKTETKTKDKSETASGSQELCVALSQ